MTAAIILIGWGSFWALALLVILQENPVYRFFTVLWDLIMKYTGLARLSRWMNRHHPNG